MKPDKKAAREKKKRSLFARVARLFFLLAFTSLVAGISAGGGLYLYFSRDLPRIASLKDYRPPVVTTVYSADGRIIGEFFKERRVVKGLDRMSPTLISAFVATEDSRFYRHKGLDFLGILRAMIKNIQAGGIVQGGSTITQQVTKTFFLSPERSYTRKIREAILARRIDSGFTKDEILFLYLNQIYLGHGAYGVEAASQAYFGKSAADLSLAECAMLAGLPQAPSRYSPFSYPKRAKQRQIYVLNRMVEEGMITDAQAAEAINQPLDIQARRNLYIEEIPFYTEFVRRYVEDKYGRDALYTGGLAIHTAADISMQKAARQSVRLGLLELDRRQGFRGPVEKLSPDRIEDFLAEKVRESGPVPPGAGDLAWGVVMDVDGEADRVLVRSQAGMGEIPGKDMRWARKPNPEKLLHEDRLKRLSDALAPGDAIQVRLEEKGEDGSWRLSLHQEPAAQGALLCLETGTGLVRAMVGGYDFARNQFNRAVQAVRQPGSAFKPIIYAAALDKGYTAASVLIDSPIVFRDDSMDFTWKPENYKRTFSGPILFREALEQSRNVVTIKILQDIGVDYATGYARRLGITQPLARDLSIALGSSGVPLSEIVTAYSVFANQGLFIKPCFVTRIEDRDGNVLEERQSEPGKAMDEETAYIMTHLLQGVVEHGTGWRAKALKRPVAGKTGTTNELNDAWFVGYTPRIVTGVWVGMDNDRSLGKGETGSRAASPIWLSFMQEILKDEPVRSFPVPEGVVFAKIDSETGLLAIPESKKTVFECFREGTAPTSYSPRPGVVRESEILLKEGL
ncbi:MAG: penicillin-binding protein 1A [Pseudomonadota bacterium]